MAHFILENFDWLVFLFGFLFAGLFAIGDVTDRKKEIKVIKKGKKKKELKWYRITCSHCGSELEFSSGHIQKKDKSEIVPGDLSYMEYIICPVCGEKVDVYGRYFKTF